MSSDGLDRIRSSSASSETGAEGAAQQTATPHLMRTLTLATVGIMAWGVGALSTFANTSMERGQKMEASAHQLVERYQKNAKIQVQAAAASRDELAKQASVTLDENLKALWSMLTMTGANEQAAEQPANTIQPSLEGEHNNGDRSTS